MHVLRLMDNRTLLACQALVSTVFMVLFFGMRTLHFRVRGVNAVSYGYLIMTVATYLMAGRGILPEFVSVIIANLTVFVAYSLLYLGILHFLETRGYRWLLHGSVSLTMLAIVYFWLVDNNITYRIAAIGMTLGVARLLMTLALFRFAAGRVHILLFAVALAVFSLSSFLQVFLTLSIGAPSNFLQNDVVQTSILMVGILFICVHGLFSLTMFAGDMAQTISSQAEIDFLTTTLNRRGIENALASELARMSRGGSVAAVLLIDIDHFKQINDTRGHAAGDAALRNLAKGISSQLRGYDKLGRFGGDEFLLLLPETSGDEAMVIAESIRGSFSRTQLTGITVSIGVAQWNRHEGIQNVLAWVDEALYRAKREGRNRALLYQQSTA
jgi:diguanylate cyclase (GGDEF)-like protein